MTWIALRDEMLTQETAAFSESLPNPPTPRPPAHWRAWQQQWHASLDDAAAHYARTGEWILLTPELRQALEPRVLWARHLCAVLAGGPSGPGLPLPAPEREAALRWLLIESWHDYGLEYYAFALLR